MSDDPRVHADASVAYSDEHLLVVEKPCGLLSHPNPGSNQPAAFLGRYDPKARRFDHPAGPLWLLHRLDKDTSGLLLAARDEASAQALRAAFEAGEVRKLYRAAVSRAPRPLKGTWEDRLEVRKGRKGAEARVLKGKPNARLEYKAVGRVKGTPHALLRIVLVTGKTHQIRAQAAQRRLPVLGDERYGDFALNKALRKQLGLRRLFLHATELEFRHPATGKTVRVTSGLPPELAKLVGK